MNGQQDNSLEPVFTINENHVAESTNSRIGVQYPAILGYRVVEKTKSYIALRIDFVSLIRSKRTF